MKENESLINPDGFNSSATSQRELDQVIRVEKLYKSYDGLVAVKGIDFTVTRGEIFGLIGADGAGKTTTFHILAGVLAAEGGKVEILGKSPQSARLSTGYLTQQFSLYLDLSIDENLHYTAGLRQVPRDVFEQRRAKYLRLMNLEKFSRRLVGRLSGGMKQKLALCCALISLPEILLLDEPTTGVDPVSRREFWDVLTTVATEGVTIVVATPYLDEAERCHRLALMHEGKIQQLGTLFQLRDHLGLHRLEVRTHYQDVAEEMLTQSTRINPSQITTICDIQTFGDRLDVLVSDAVKGEAEVRQVFEQHQWPLKTIKVTEPTLENVFVHHLRGLGDEPQYRAFPYHQRDSPQCQLTVAIGATALQKVFGDFPAVKGINLQIRYGEIYGLLGANGTGKTTVIKMLCGLLEPTAGEITLAGQSHHLRSRSLRKRIGYMSQKFTLYDDLTIQENLEFYCGVYGVPRSLRRHKIDWVLTTCGLIQQKNMLTGQLPGGWKQRVALGASVLHEPEILFLDEPTSGVDPLARRQFWRFINDFARQGTAILVTTHYLEEAEQCNRIGFMVAGQLVTQGSPSEIKAKQPGQLIELRIDRTPEACQVLKTRFASWKVSIFGDRIHLVLDNPDQEITQVRSILAQEGLRIKALDFIPFSLEDAFIGIVQRIQEEPEQSSIDFAAEVR